MPRTVHGEIMTISPERRTLLSLIGDCCARLLAATPLRTDKIMMTAALLAGVDMDQRVKPISAAGVLEHVGYRPIVNRSEVEADLASTIRARSRA